MISVLNQVVRIQFYGRTATSILVFGEIVWIGESDMKNEHDESAVLLWDVVLLLS